MAFLSIIVPVYKVESYIHNCVNSILKQSFIDYELILVDDGSPDNCPEICDSFSIKDKRIKVVHKKNGGLTSAWLEGLKNISFDTHYITFIDSDDYISGTYLQEFVDVACEFAPDVIIGNTIKFYEEEERPTIQTHIGLFDKKKLESDIYPQILFNGKFHGRNYQVSRWGKFFEKNILLNNIKYCNPGTSYSEDLNITFPIMLDAEKVYFLEPSKGVYYYRMNPMSMLHSYDRTMLASIKHVFPTLIQVCKDKNREILIDQVVADSLAASVQYYKNELLNPLGLKQTKRNIQLFCNDNMLKQAISSVRWNQFRKLNVLIIKSYKNYNWFYKDIVTPLLRIIKKSGIKKPS